VCGPGAVREGGEGAGWKKGRGAEGARGQAAFELWQHLLLAVRQLLEPPDISSSFAVHTGSLHSSQRGVQCSVVCACWLPCAVVLLPPQGLPSFQHDRAKTDRESTTMLSPWIHFGTISVRHIYYRWVGGFGLGGGGGPST